MPIFLNIVCLNTILETTRRKTEEVEGRITLTLISL